MLIVAGIVREFVRRMRIFVAGLRARVLVDLKMSNRFLALLAEALAPLDRIAASQPGRLCTRSASPALGWGCDW
jgi:hypothetical protein